MLKFKKLAAVVLTAATITSTVCLNNVQAFATTQEKIIVGEKQENVIVSDELISSSTGEQITAYGSTSALEDNQSNIKMIAKAKFFEDPYDDSLTVFLSTDGSFINSGLSQTGSYYKAEMYWPSAYECSIEVKDEKNSGGETKIVSSAPTNSISSSEVSNTVGYSIGGSVGIEGKTPSAGLNGGYNYSQSISYTQPHFTTILEQNSLKKAQWRVEFSSTPDGYDKHSKNITYGNQMFMLSRLYNTGNNNLTKKDKLSTLISGGFSPNFLVALKAPKNKIQTIVDMKLGKDVDKYSLDWSGVNWYGHNFSNKKYETHQRFVINWQTHTIKPLGGIKSMIHDTRPKSKNNGNDSYGFYFQV